MTVLMLQENMLQAEDIEKSQRKARKQGKDEAMVDDEDVKPVGRQLESVARFLGKVLSKSP